MCVCVNWLVQFDFLSQKKSLQNKESTYTSGLKSKPLPLIVQPGEQYS